MALSRERIVTAGYRTLRDYGLAAVSMRRLAQDLKVAPGALYYHVANKQELLAAIAEQVLPDTIVGVERDGGQAATAAAAIRAALLQVRDGAELISFVNAFRPGLLTPLARLAQLAGGELSAREAHWAGQTLVHYVLGFVAQEQNHTELVRAGVLADADGATPGSDGAERDLADSAAAFTFGVDAILRGVRPGAASTT